MGNILNNKTTGDMSDEEIARWLCLFDAVNYVADKAEKIDLITATVDLIILPEMFTSGFTMHPEKLAKNEGEKTIRWMQKIASVFPATAA